MKSFVRLLAISIFANVLPEGLEAAPITFEFVGRITTVAGADASVRYAGVSTFSGSYTFESTTADAQPGNTAWGVYNNLLPDAFSATLGSDVITQTSPYNYIGIAILDDYLGTTNEYFFTATALNGIPGGSSIQFDFGIFYEAPFGSDALPTLPPDLIQATGNTAQFYYNSDGFTPNWVTGELISLSIRSDVPSVPEPGSWLLIAIGLTGFFGLRLLATRNRWKRSK